MTHPLNFPDTSFTAAQAEALTDVSVDKQRDWRRRGILPSGEGARWTRFSVYDLIQLAFVAEANKAGLDLKTAAALADEALRPALAHILAEADRASRYVVQAQFEFDRDVHVVSSLAALAQIEEAGIWKESPPQSFVIIDVHAVVDRVAARIEQGQPRPVVAD